MDRRKVATVEFEVQEESNTAEEVIRRLDDGNDFPGFELEKDGDRYILYHVE